MALRVAFMDASALVMLVAKEPGSDLVARLYGDINFHLATTELCKLEALRALGQKWKASSLPQGAYHSAAHELLCCIRTPTVHHGRIHADTVDLGEDEVFFRAMELANRHRVDLSDALQLYFLLHGKFRSLAGPSQVLLVTGEKALTAAAKAEGLDAWYCREGPYPWVSPLV